MEIALVAAGFVVYVWLLIIVHRQGIREQLPWFALYVLWEVVAQLVALVSLPVSRKLYFQLYWWIEAVDIFLKVAAVRESFLRIFQGLTRKREFRWAVWIIIGLVVAYSAWESLHASPMLKGHLDAFVVDAEFLFRWGIAGIALLTALVGVPLKEGISREDAVVAGFGVASLIFVMYLASLSAFPHKFNFFTKYIPSMGYFLAAFGWIYIFSRPIKQFGFEELGMGPDEIRKALRRYRRFGERL